MSGRRNNPSLTVTSLGWGWFVLCLIAFLLGTNYNNNVVFMFGCLLLGIWLLAAILTYRNVKGVSCVRWRVDSCFAGDDAVFRLLIESKDRSQHFEIGCAPKHQPQVSQARLGVVDRNERKWLLHTLPTANRGWCSLEDMVMGSTWPFGLWRASISAPKAAPCLVYPRSQGAQELPWSHTTNADGQSLDDLAGVREYMPGDNVRRLDWKAAARSDQLSIKTFEGLEFQQSVWLKASDVSVPDFEQKLQQLTCWVLECASSGIQYGLDVEGGAVPPDSGRRHQDKVLALLALVQQR